MILVTGGAGYIGSHTLIALAEAGYDILVVDNLSLGHREAVLHGRLVELDLGDADGLARLLDQHRVEGIIHFAALALVGQSVADPRAYFDNNVIAGLNLVGLAAERSIPVIFSSTCAVYGLPESLPLKEDHPKAPINPYGFTKLVLERALEEYGRAYGLSWISLRYFNAAGADPLARVGERHDPETHLIPLILKAALGLSEGVKIFGEDYPTRDGTCIRDYVHVSDLARAHVAALKLASAEKTGLALNLGTGQGYTVREVIDACQIVTGRTIEVAIGPRRPGDPAELVADPSRAEAKLDWRARYTDIEEIIDTAWSWHRKMG